MSPLTFTVAYAPFEDVNPFKESFNLSTSNNALEVSNPTETLFSFSAFSLLFTDSIEDIALVVSASTPTFTLTYLPLFSRLPKVLSKLDKSAPTPIFIFLLAMSALLAILRIESVSSLKVAPTFNLMCGPA